ncbi:hypothetical protein [Streptomyces sp. 3N207]|uniref:hypothetical protein n=1 Tax=Streptomyces sp. 3N207 TaxID=3457417 RepID=UPI003FD385F1
MSEPRWRVYGSDHDDPHPYARPGRSYRELVDREGRGVDDLGNHPKTRQGRPLGKYTDLIEALRRLEAESLSRLTFK